MAKILAYRKALNEFNKQSKGTYQDDTAKDLEEIPASGSGRGDGKGPGKRNKKKQGRGDGAASHE